MQDLGHLLAANQKKKRKKRSFILGVNPILNSSIHPHSRDVKESSEMNNEIVLQTNQNTNRLCVHN
jgi:hypothetical protein